MAKERNADAKWEVTHAVYTGSGVETYIWLGGAL